MTFDLYTLNITNRAKIHENLFPHNSIYEQTFKWDPSRNINIFTMKLITKKSFNFDAITQTLVKKIVICNFQNVLSNDTVTHETPHVLCCRLGINTKARPSSAQQATVNSLRAHSFKYSREFVMPEFMNTTPLGQITRNHLDFQ